MSTVIKGVGKKLIIDSDSIDIIKSIGKDINISIKEIDEITFDKATMSKNGTIHIEWNGNREDIMFRCFSNDIVEKVVIGIKEFINNDNSSLIIDEGTRISVLEQLKIENKEKLEEKKLDKIKIQELKDKKVPYCPKCHSTSITTVDKKLSVGRAAVGGALLGGTGAILGGLTSKKVELLCMNCGHKFKPGKK